MSKYEILKKKFTKVTLTKTNTNLFVNLDKETKVSEIVVSNQVNCYQNIAVTLQLG